MTCPNFKNGPKNGLGPLEVNRSKGKERNNSNANEIHH
jgi:hypothetical protein